MKDKKDADLELNLNRITVYEEALYPETFPAYKEIALGIIKLNNLYLSEAEVLRQTQEKNIKHVLEQYPHILKTTTRKKTKNNEYETITQYIDLSVEYYIQPEDFSYDTFFVYRLRQIDVLKIDTFLNYHHSSYYSEKTNEFVRFLKLCLRKYETKLLSASIVQTVKEWIEQIEKQGQNNLQGITNKPRKNKAKREAQDNKTSLSQEQTVLLMHYLQQAKVFLRDEDLLNTEFAEAFATITGYSQNTLRQDLKKYQHYQSKENLGKLIGLLNRLEITIGADLKQVTKNKKALHEGS